MADITSKNKEYFDKMASKYEGDFAESLQQIETTVRGRRHWLGVDWVDENTSQEHDVKVLDYACGPGTISRALLGLATKFVGLDVSDGMIAEFNKFARNAGIPPEKMFAQQGNLLAETLSEDLAGPEFFNFDLVAVGMAFHHFADPELAMKRFAARMKKGGVCLIIDMVPHQHADMHDHPEAGPTIKRKGFGMQEMKEIFEGAGITREFDYVIMEKPIVFTMDGERRETTLFMAKAKL